MSNLQTLEKLSARVTLLYVLPFQDTVLPEAVTYWSKALRVRKTESKIRLNRLVVAHDGGR